MTAVVYEKTFRVSKRYQFETLNYTLTGITGQERRVTLSDRYEKCQAPIIWGAWDTKEIIDCRTSVVHKHKGNFLHLDTPLLGVRHPNTIRHIRVGLNSWLGDYNNDNVTPARWNKLSKELNLQLKPFKPKGESILIACERTNAYVSRYEQKVEDWVDDVIYEIRKYSDRKIVVRAKPTGPRLTLKKKYENVVVENDKRMLEVGDINYWAVVARTSGIATKSVLDGVPTYSTYKDNHVYDIVEHSFENIENPVEPNLSGWLSKIAYTTWTFEELRDGTMWNHFKERLYEN